MSTPTRRRDRDSGAVAIMVAVLAVVLMTVAALSVDLGNAWARKRAVQTQADLAALSAGHMLPQTISNRAALLAEVATYLNKPNNNVQDQPTVTAAQLDDNNLANGEVDFYNNGTRMRVIAPASNVDFFLADVAGFDDVDVNAQATVEIQSLQPRMVDVLPFALPSGCPYGPGMADTGPGPAATPSPTATPTADFTPANGDSGNHRVASITPASLGNNSTSSISVSLTNLPNNSTAGVIRFRVGASTIVDRNVTWPEVSQQAGDARTVSVTPNTAVTGTERVWKVWLVLGTGNQEKYSATSANLTVGNPPSSSPSPSPSAAVGCSVSASGNYGQLDSPRNGVNQRPERFAQNIALGLDHQVVPFPTANSDVCAGNSGNNPIPGANLDEAPSTNGRNCLNIDPGNDGPKVMEGLITGVNNTTIKGRLDNSFTASDRPTTCAGPRTVNGTSINDENLTCYLKAGATKAQLIAQTGNFDNLLDPRITDSPRFVWIPVLRTQERINDKWQPIKMFVPAFITGETVTGPGDTDNGIKVNAQGNSVDSIQVFTFNPLALPIDERDPSTVYDPGGRSIVRLVD